MARIKPEDRAMPDIPACELRALLARLLASSRDPETRAAAIASFQQLHAELRRWHEGLVAVLRAYPGCTQSGAPRDYDLFRDRLAACRDALGEGADAGPYLQRRPRVMDAIQTCEASSALALAELRATPPPRAWPCRN
jgi:hypothetical protein